MTSGIRRDVDAMSAVLRYYAAFSGRLYRLFGTPLGPIFKGQDVKSWSWNL
jgi:hypothetical protein